MRRLLLSMALASIATIGWAPAQEPAPETSPDVVVRGERTEEAIRAFIGELAVTPRGVDQLSRWDWRICPGVAGLRSEHAQFVIDRIARRAMDVGLFVGEPGCRSNVLIIVSMTPDTIAEELFAQHRRTLGYYSERGEATLGRGRLDAFVASDAPVRWWHVSRAFDQDGRSVGDATFPDLTFGDASFVVRHGGASRLRYPTHHNFTQAYVIVDGRHMSDGFDLAALADYLSMVVLAQVDPQAETRELSTILNLFGSADAPHALTEWDVGYLRGLYATNMDDNRNRQQTIIRSTMEAALEQ